MRLFRREFSTGFTYCLLLGLLVFATHYSRFLELGLYEDDYAFIGRYLDTPFKFSTVRAQFTNTFRSVQGRPLAFFFPYAVTTTLGRTGGLTSVYCTGFVIVWINAVLLYVMIGRLLGPLYGFCGAAVFVLFPADTTKALLTHALILQPGLSFTLGALCLYGRRRLRPWSYVMASGSLFFYEIAFLPFVVAPLLTDEWRKGTGRRLMVHLVIVSIIVATLIAARGMGGEERMQVLLRVAPVHTLAFCELLIANMLTGPAVCAGTFLTRPLSAIAAATPQTFVLGMVCAAICWLAWRLYRRDTTENCAETERKIDIKGISGLVRINSVVLRGAEIMIGGLAGAAVSYCFTLPPHRPWDTLGRLTSVHLAASVSWAFIGTGVAAIVRTFCMNSPARRLTARVVSLAWIALLAGFHGAVQNEFVSAWHIQRHFWRSLLTVCPDIGPQTVIFVDQETIPRSPQAIKPFSWALTLTLRMLWAQEDSQQYLTMKPSSSSVRAASGGLEWLSPPGFEAPEWRPLYNGDVIEIFYCEDSLCRRDGLLSIGPYSVQSRPVSPYADSLRAEWHERVCYRRPRLASLLVGCRRSRQ